MPVYDISRDELLKVIAQLDQALYNHLQWYKILNRTLICRLPSDKHDISPDAYKECLFGQWYSSYPPQELLKHPGFVALGEEHKRMHELAAHILVTANSKNDISTYDYDNFVNVLERLQLELLALKRELEDMLHNRDPLTGAISRVNMLYVLREQQELVKRDVQKSCLAMMDLDLFKNINDGYGHPVGDQVLAATARYIIEHLRPYDKIFRYGGEEFLICIQDDLKYTANMIERIRSGIAEMPIDIGQKEPIHITVSFGLASLMPNITVEESIDHADKAMYAAKKAGRNCIKIWEPSMDNPKFSS